MDKIHRYINHSDGIDSQEKRYILVNRRDIPLNSFHGNGGWRINDVFPCSWRCHSVFYSPEEAQEHLDYIINNCLDQQERWGDWFTKAMKYANKLTIKELVYIEYS